MINQDKDRWEKDAIPKAIVFDMTQLEGT